MKRVDCIGARRAHTKNNVPKRSIAMAPSTTLNTKTVTELRKMASSAHITGYSRMRKAELVAALAPVAKIAKRTAARKTPTTDDGLAGLTVKELRTRAKQAGVAVPAKARKADIIRALYAQPAKKRLAKRTSRPQPAALPVASPQPERVGKHGPETTIEIPCPNFNKPQIEAFLSAPRLTHQQLGIFAGVSHALYPHPVGSLADREFLAQNKSLYKRHHGNFWSDFIAEIANHERVRDLCSVDDRGRPMALVVGVSRNARMSPTKQIADMNEANAEANGLTVEMLRKRVINHWGKIHALKPPPGYFKITHRKEAGGSSVPISERWMRSSGIGRCGDDRPWLPISVGVHLAEGARHAMFVLINRGTGHTYLFEPNGAYAQTARRFAYALGLLPPLYQLLMTEGGMSPSEWRTTTFVTDNPLSGDSYGIGPQGRQGVPTQLLDHASGTCAAWSILFYHLFILNHMLEPDDILKHMLDPKQRQYLGHIIGRYSMFVAKNVLNKLQRSAED